jgi:hypothetical protein
MDHQAAALRAPETTYPAQEAADRREDRDRHRMDRRASEARQGHVRAQVAGRDDRRRGQNHRRPVAARIPEAAESPDRAAAGSRSRKERCRLTRANLRGPAADPAGSREVAAPVHPAAEPGHRTDPHQAAGTHRHQERAADQAARWTGPAGSHQREAARRDGRLAAAAPRLPKEARTGQLPAAGPDLRVGAAGPAAGIHRALLEDRRHQGPAGSHREVARTHPDQEELAAG